MCSSVEAIGMILAGLDALAEVDDTGLGDPALLDTLRDLEPAFRRFEAERSRFIGLAHRRGAATADGAVSTAAWLSTRLRMARAGQQIQIAQAAAQVPEVGAAYAAGQIGAAHVAAIAEVLPDLDPQVLTGGAGALLATEAAELTPQATARMAHRVRDYFAPHRADARARQRLERRGLDYARTYDGMLAIRGLLDPDAGELFATTLTALTPPPAVGDTRTGSQRRADALADLCRHAGNHAPTNGGAKPHVLVTLDYEKLVGQLTQDRPTSGTDTTDTTDTGRDPDHSEPEHGEPEHGEPEHGEPEHGRRLDRYWLGWRVGPTLGDGTPITPSTARRLACDAAIIPAVLGSRSEPLDLGRATRTVSTAQRRALTLRDGGCRFPGCDRPPAFTDAHHLQPWTTHHGQTDLDNLLLLCRWHHTAVHEGGWQLHLDRTQGTVTATRPDGRAYDMTSQPRAQPP